MANSCPFCGCGFLVELNSQNGYRCRACDRIVQDYIGIIDRTNETVIPQPDGRGKSAKEIYKQSIRGIMEILCDFTESCACGTGFFISDTGYLITNAHVVINGDRLERGVLADRILARQNHSSEGTSMQVVCLDKKNDLALLKANTSKLHFLRLAKQPPEIGEKVYAVGNGHGEGLLIVDGIIGDMDRDFEGHRTFVFNGLVTTGCSGGPILNEQGEVCGVTVGQIKDTPGMNYGIPLDIILNFLGKVKKIKRCVT